MENEPLLYKVENKTAFFTINREEKRNSLTPRAITLFLEYLEKARNDDQVNSICITGAGDKAFCTGAELGDAMAGGQDDAFRDYAALLETLSAFPKPVVGRVNGFCLAGGMGLMLACDLVVAVETAQFGTPEVNVGLFPMMIGALIFRNVSRKKAMEMILLGERMGAEEARKMDMINRVVPGGDLDDAVERILAKLNAKSPIGMKMGKEAFSGMAEMELGQALEYLSGKLREVAMTEDAKEGITAFMEKRKPVYRGR